MDIGALETRPPAPRESRVVRRDTAYDQFDRKHPAFGTDGIELKTHVSLRQQNREEKHTLIEAYSPTDSVSTLTATDKEEDAAIVAKTPDGRIIVAVADGVSNAVKLACIAFFSLGSL